jgi:hypothetical protein
MIFMRIAVLLSLLLIACAANAEDSAPVSHLVVAPCDVGEHYQFEKVSCAIELKNTGDKPVRVTNAHAKLRWDSIDSEPIVVAPHSTNYINARVDLLNSIGFTQRNFGFTTDESPGARRGAAVRAFVATSLDQDRPTLDFGTVLLGDKELPKRTMTLSSREVADFKIVDIVEKPDYVDVELGPDHKSVSARLRSNAPWGLLDDFIKLKIDTPRQPVVWIALKGDVHGRVVPDSNPFALGVIRAGQTNEYLIRLTSTSGEDFRVGKMDLENVKGSAESAPCTPAAKGCRLVKLRIDDSNPLGKVEGTLRVTLPDFDHDLPIRVWGMLLSQKTEVHQLDELLANSVAEGGQSKSPAAASKPVDLAAALKNGVRKNEPPPPGNGPLLKWSAAHQESVYGYAIYRADNAAGPFVRVNKDTILASLEGDDKSGAYQWRDTTAEAGKAYWYSIGLINRDGSKQDLTGAQKVVAK